MTEIYSKSVKKNRLSKHIYFIAVFVKIVNAEYAISKADWLTELKYWQKSILIYGHYYIRAEDGLEMFKTIYGNLTTSNYSWIAVLNVTQLNLKNDRTKSSSSIVL